MKRLAYFVLTLFLLIPLALAGLVGLSATEAGTRWLATAAGHFAPGELSIGQIHGTLLRRFELEQVSYRLPPHQFELAHLTLAWQPKALFSKHLKIEEITASGLNYQGPAAPQAEPTPFTLPAIRLPLVVTIQRAELTDLAIVQGEARLSLKHVLLDAELMGDRFIIHGFRVLVEPWSLTATGEVTLQGDYPLKLAIDWRGKADLLLAGQGKLSGDLRELIIEHRLTTPFEAVTFGTMNALDPDLAVELHGGWKNLSWPPVTSDYRSPTGSYRVHGSLNAYQLELEAQLEGKTIPALQVHLSGRGDTKSLMLTPFTVHPPKGQLTATGKVTWAPTFTWQLALKGRDLNPKTLLPDWPGRLELAASSCGQWDETGLMLSLKIDHLRGSLRQQPVDAAGTLELKNGQWRSDKLELVSGANRLSLKGRYGKRIDLSFSLEGRRLSDLWPGLQGTLNARGRLKGDLSFPEIQAEAQGRGIAWQDNRLETLRMTLRFAPDAPTSRSDLSLTQLQLAGLQIERLNLSARGGFDRHRLTLDLKAPQGRLITALAGRYRAKVWQVGIDRVQLEPPEGKRLAFPGDGTLAAAARLDFNAQPTAVAGNLDLEIPNLARLAPWLPQLDRPEGRLSVALRVAGPVDNPKPEGYLKLTGGAAGIRAAGIRLTAIEASIAGSGGRFDLTGSLRSGEGRLDFSGWAEPPGKLHLTLKGDDLEVVRRTQAKILASPKLVFDLTDRTGHLKGGILLPKADIQLKALPEGSVTVSEDEFIVGAEAEPAEPPFRLTSRVELALGDQVRFKGFGLTTKLSGKLEIRSRNGQTSAHGVIDLKQGIYKAYGQNLRVEKGRLIFTGPVDQPYLELTAVRTIEREAITAFLEVRGPAKKPVLQVKSQPPMPETEALAYLLTGRSFKTGGAADQTAVAKAALSMGIGLALPWIRKLGLEGVAMQTGITYEDTALTVGKYLTPDLYVGYALSLFNGVGRALVRYQINRFFAVEAGAGVSQSVDLFYTIETD